ncbi:MAG TPA: hypothetical protein VK988_08755, partial [Acidimicrobiales bacterium]|nr:hypothetical protein [Acidimicrobiales bacterium]
RRHRADELRFGLATLGARYRQELETAGAHVGELGDVLAAVDAIVAAARALARNPNEALLLQALLTELPPLGTAPELRH